jgi:gas vesicle protein
MNTGRVILSVVAGAAAGAALGLLYAPDRGENTRRKIAEKGEDLRDNIKDTVNKTVERTKSRASDFVERGSSKVHDVTSDVNPEII